MDAITSQYTAVTGAVSQVFTMATGNPLLCTFIAASLLGLGIRMFCRLKRI